MPSIQLTTDIHSHGKERRLYGKAGDVVEVIAERGEVLIVQGKERFPVRRELTSEIKKL